MAEADVSKMPNGVKLNGDHSQAKAKHMATAAGGSSGSGPESTQCRVCSKRVYEMEKLLADNVVYHKTCFKCCKCTRTLRVGNYASMDGQIFCKPHFIECFKQKGNYEEGFGKERHKNKWLKSEDSSENEADDHEPASRGRSAEKSHATAAATAVEQITVSAAPQLCHSAPPTAAAAPPSAAAGADHVDGDGAVTGGAADDPTAAAASKSNGEPIVVSVSEKKSKFFQAVAESSKPREHKPEPGRLKSNAWSGGRADGAASAQPSASSQRLAADGLGAGKSVGVGDKKSLFEAPASSGGAAAASAPPLPKSGGGVALRPRRLSPVRSSESWRRSASVDDYDGRWALSSVKTSGGRSGGGNEGESEAPSASGERQSRSTTRAPPPGRAAPAAGELSVVEQKRKAFQLRQNTEPAAATAERRTSPASASLSPGSSLKHKTEEFERRSAEQAEAARREAPPARSKSEREEPAPAAAAAAGAAPDTPPKQQLQTVELGSVEEAIVVSSASHEQLECAPPSTGHDQQHPGQPLAAVPEAVEETAAAAAAAAENGGRCDGRSTAEGRGTLTVEVGEDECFERQDAPVEPLVKEIASIKSKFEAGSEVDGKPDSAYRSAAREEVDVIRSASAGVGGARSRYERALEETSRKQPPKLTSSIDQADGAAAAVGSADDKPAAEVASLKSRFESGGVVRDGESSQEESPAAPRLTSSGTARLRYQKALEDSTAKPLPKTGLTDVPVKGSCPPSSGSEDGAVQAAADEVEKQTADADSGKPKDVEFHLVAISSLKSKFEAGGAAAEQSPRATVAATLDADAAVLQGSNVLARYQKALEESTSRPVAKTEVPPTPTRSASVRVRATSGADAVDVKPPAAAVSPSAAAGDGAGERAPATAAAAAVVVPTTPLEQPRSPLLQTTVSLRVSTVKEAAPADKVEEKVVVAAVAAEPQEAAPPIKEDASGPKEPRISTSASIEVTVAAATASPAESPRDATRPTDIQLQVKDTGAAAVAAASVKSPVAASPVSAPVPAGSSQLHRIMNKFQSNADAQPAPQPHGSRPEPKPLKIPNFEGRRPSADGGDGKALSSVTSPPFWTKSTKSLKERFEVQEPAQSGSRGVSVDQRRRASGPSSDDGSQSTAHAEDPRGDDAESVGAVSSSVDPID